MTHHLKVFELKKTENARHFTQFVPMPTKIAFYYPLEHGEGIGRKPISLCMLDCRHLENSSPSPCETFEGWFGPYVASNNNNNKLQQQQQKNKKQTKNENEQINKQTKTTQAKTNKTNQKQRRKNKQTKQNKN